jgi:hypothetical protein
MVQILAESAYFDMSKISWILVYVTHVLCVPQPWIIQSPYHRPSLQHKICKERAITLLQVLTLGP